MLIANMLFLIVARCQRLIICSTVARLFFDFLCASMIVVTVEKWLFEHFVDCLQIRWLWLFGSGGTESGEE